MEPWRSKAGLFALALLFSAACVFGDSSDADDGTVDFEVEEGFSFEVPLIDQTVIELEALNGRIEITGNANATSVQIAGIRRVSSDSRADAERRLADLRVDVSDEIDRVLVRTVQPQNNRGRSYEIDYDITAPLDLDLLVSTINGPIIVQDVDRGAAITSVNSLVTLRRVVGDTAVSLVNGDIDADVTLRQGGEIVMSIVNGETDLEIPAVTSAEFSARAANGSVSASNLDFHDLVQSSRSLTGTLGSGDGTIDLDVVNGAIRAQGYD